MATFPDEFAGIIVCPACRHSLTASAAADKLVFLECTGCGNRYPVVDDIPILLVDRAMKATSAG